MAVATIEAVRQSDAVQLVLSGEWTLATMPQPISGFELASARSGDQQARVGLAVDLPPRQRGRDPALARVGAAVAGLSGGVFRAPSAPGAGRGCRPRPPARAIGMEPLAWLTVPGGLALSAGNHLAAMVAMIGQLVLDVAYLCVHRRDIPWREFSANLYKSGAQALPVTALIGFLIGVVLSYLSSLQLRTFGADVFIVNLLGISIVRELGPVLVAILVAGRSGSAMTAQIGVMRVTEEIDALATMGVSRSQRLVLPKVLALAVAMPLLVIWCSAAGIIGGMVSANLQMGLSYGFFVDTLPRVVPVANVWIGLSKGVVFGVLIALIACHFGLRVKPNTESLSARTTTSVVTSITVVILVDAVFAVFTRNLGLP
jgi:phospholipid/cholesterol/gamma-HCH transport system permease protein